MAKNPEGNPAHDMPFAERLRLWELHSGVTTEATNRNAVACTGPASRRSIGRTNRDILNTVSKAAEVRLRSHKWSVYVSQ